MPGEVFAERIQDDLVFHPLLLGGCNVQTLLVPPRYLNVQVGFGVENDRHTHILAVENLGNIGARRNVRPLGAVGSVFVVPLSAQHDQSTV
jgi:hypothetical protein